MGFFSNFFRMRSGAKSAEAAKPAMPQPEAAAPAPGHTQNETQTVSDRPLAGQSTADTTAMGQQAAGPTDGGAAQPAEAPAAPAIWDTPEEGDAPLATAVSRARRNKTRMLGFDAAPAGGIGLFEDEAETQATPAAATAAPVEAAPAPASAPRTRRNKTRMIGFETSAGEALDLFAPEEPADPVPDRPLDPALPVGWVVVTAGPGRGTSITLTTGSSSIGSGAAHEISVSAGPPSLTAVTHGTLHHAPESDAFTLAPAAGGMDLTRNGAPVTHETALTSGDTIGVGDVHLHFVALSASGFRWAGAETDSDHAGTGGLHATQA